MIKAIPMEDWLRGCIYHDGRQGYVTLPIDKVHQIANYIQRTRRSGMDGLIDLEVVRKDENNSEKPNNCEYAKNPSGDVWECGCFLDTYCEHQIYDRNPDGTINIVECGYEPQLVKESTEVVKNLVKTEPTISKMEQVDKDINVRSKEAPYIDIETGILHWCGWKYKRIYEGEPQIYKINPKEPTNMPKCFDCEDFFTCDGQCDEIECEKCKHFREEADTYTKQCEFYFMECRYEPKDEPQTDEEYINNLPWTEVGNGEQTDDAYFLKLMGAVERGEISDAGANQAWYEYINHKDKPQTERSE